MGTKRWTLDEDERLQSLIEAGRTYSYVAEKLKRTPAAVRGLDAHGNGPRCAQISGPTVGARERSAPSISWWQTRAG
jgi:hypothetical protein